MEPGSFDRFVWNHLPGLVSYGALIGFVGFILWRCLQEFRERGGNIDTLLRLLLVVVMIGGTWAWFGYFGDHGMFITWPLIVIVVVVVLALARAYIADRQIDERAEELRKLPSPPNLGGPAKKEDFEDW